MTFPTEEPFGGYDDEIPIDCDSAAQRWWELLEGALPWARMELDDAFGMMRGVIRELLNEGREARHEARDLRLALAARAHGQFRRRQQCDLVAVSREFDALIEAIADELRADGYGETVIRDMLIGLGGELAAAQLATVSGWNHRLTWQSTGVFDWFSDGTP